MDVTGRFAGVVPDGAEWIRVPGNHGECRRLGEGLRALAPGTPVVLLDQRPGSRWRSRGVARGGGVRVERELLAIPSLDDPVFAVEDTPSALQAFWGSFATVPPGEATRALIIAIAVRSIAVVRPWRLLGAVIPGRLTIGYRA